LPLSHCGVTRPNTPICAAPLAATLTVFSTTFVSCAKAAPDHEAVAKRTMKIFESLAGIFLS
jgi:hypothetical protein